MARLATRETEALKAYQAHVARIGAAMKAEKGAALADHYARVKQITDAHTAEKNDALDAYRAAIGRPEDRGAPPRRG